MTSTAWAPEKLKSAREAAGISPEQAAAAIGVHRTTIYDAERGKHVLRADRAASLATLYGVSLEQFFTHEADGTSAAPARGNRTPRRRSNAPGPGSTEEPREQSAV